MRNAKTLDFNWVYLNWFGARRSMEPNGIQEVDGSIPFSSTNKTST